MASGQEPRDIGEHLTKAVREVAKENPALSGVIDIHNFDDSRHGERDINPAKLRAVVETFSDPRYRLGLSDASRICLVVAMNISFANLRRVRT